MKNTIKSLVLLLTLGTTYGAFAQQMPQFTQYFNNSILINPAIAGTLEEPEIRTVFRDQWSAIKEGPQTMHLMYNGNPRLRSTGFAAYVHNDKQGPLSRTGINATYSYKVFFNDNKSFMSFGLSGMFNYFKINTEELQFDAAGNSDAILLKGNFRAFYPNASFGFLVKNPDSWFGFAVPELINSNISSTDEFNIVQEKRHFYFTAGKSFKSGDNNALIPMIMLKKVTAAPAQLTLGLRYNINRTFDIGAAYNTGDALALMFGYTYKEQYKFSYSYDITTSALSSYAGATHEVCLAYVFLKKQEEETPKE